ncbi:MAG: TRAP transporter large permease subunit [Steroidobacteraceae bacterium]
MALVHGVENLLLAAVLALLVVLGSAGASTGFAHADELIRHLTLLVGMLGGMVAARDGRLLSMGTFAHALPARLKPAIEVYAGLVGTTVSAVLTLASWQFVSQEAGSSSALAFGVPRIALQAVMPAGFAFITLRLAYHASRSIAIRVAVLAIAIAIAAAVAQPEAGLEALRAPLLVALVIAILFGAPLFTGLAGIALIFFVSVGDPIASVPLDHYDQVTNPLLATLPLFTLAGYVVTATGAARRLVRLLWAWTGPLRGGPAVVTVLACAFFTAFTGGSGITILALGGLLMPILMSSRYADRTALGLVTGAGSLGVLFAPCLPLILYSIVAQVSIEEMFLGGALPGLLMVILACAWGVTMSPGKRVRPRFSRKRVLVTTWRAKWDLLLPVVPLVLIFGGYVLPVPAAALTALYAILVAGFINRDLPRGRALVEVMCECGMLVGGVLLILGTAMGLTNLLITEHVPDRLTGWVGTAIESRWLFLLLLNLVMIVLGCVIEIFSAIIVVAPLVVPVAMAFDVNPVHLGVIMLASLELGYLMPPIGLNLLMSASRFRKPMLEVARASLPMLLVLATGVALITLFPQMSLWLPQWFAARPVP